MQVSLQGSFKVKELQVRFKATRYQSPAKITAPEHVHQLLLPVIKGQPRELLFSIALDPSNSLIGFEVVSQGTSDASLATPRELMKAIILTNANAFIVAHNHPSGNLEASQEDRNVAKRIAHAAQILDLKFLDFLILTNEGFYSFAQSEPDILKPIN
jgi:DNA repair protein RadC